MKRLPSRIETLPIKRSGDADPSVRKPHTYLRVGDKVFHRDFKSWGCGVVVEARASRVPGGFCYARIQFQDGKKRVFDNSYSSACCCYYTGITLLNRIELI